MRMKRLGGLFLAAAVLVGIFAAGDTVSAAPNCKTLCAAALKATGGSKHLKYTSTGAIDFGALSGSDRNRVKSMRYVCDSKEVYSLCVMKAGSSSDAKKLLKAMQKYKKNNTGSNYLSDYTTVERKVFKSAVCGKKGKYVWYIAMSPSKSVNNKGQAALKKKL